MYFKVDVESKDRMWSRYTALNVNFSIYQRVHDNYCIGEMALFHMRQSDRLSVCDGVKRGASLLDAFLA